MTIQLDGEILRMLDFLINQYENETDKQSDRVSMISGLIRNVYYNKKNK